MDVRPLSNRPSGVGHYIRNLLRALASRESDDSYCLIHHDPNAIDRESTPANAALWRAPLSHENHPLGDIWRDFLLPRRLRRAAIDIFHGPAFMIPRDHRLFRSVVTIHDLVAFLYPETVPWKYSIYMRKQIRSAIKRADRVIAISYANRDELIKLTGISPRRIRVVYHGVEPRFRPAPDSQRLRGLLERYGIDRPYLFYLGNIEPRKNLLGVFEAFEEITEHTKDNVRLVVGGARGWLCRDILERAKRMNGRTRPIFTGYLSNEEAPAILAGARAFLFPSIYEGFGLPILEAMACGVPVITSDRGAMKEIAGAAGLLVNPLDSSSIAEGIIKILDDSELAGRLSTEGERRASHFSWERTAEKTLEVYREALAAS